MKRRKFNQILTISSLATFFSGCEFESEILSLPKSNEDSLRIHHELRSQILFQWGDLINDKEKIGFNSYDLCCLEKDENTLVMWVSFSEIHSGMITNKWHEEIKSQTDIAKEMESIGGAVLEIRRDSIDTPWRLIKSEKNFRITGLSTIDFAWDPQKLEDIDFSGTVGNFGCEKTPWGTFISGESCAEKFYGEDLRNVVPSLGALSWEDYYPSAAKNYGWIHEVNPITKESKKLVALGRCNHNGVAIKESVNGQIVLYTCDNYERQCIYKFIPDSKTSFESGELFVANLNKNKWVSLKWENQKKLRENFKDQTEVLFYLREAAHLMGGTKFDNPQDLAVHPETGDLYVSISENVAKGNSFGSIIRIQERNEKGNAQLFLETYLAGGPKTQFACPANLAFDSKGNLWFSTNIPSKKLNKLEYIFHKNNALMLSLREGVQKDRPIRIASAPADARISGICFTKNEKTLFICVQNPGALSTSKNTLTSHWPNGRESFPRPSVVALHGPLLKTILG